MKKLLAFLAITMPAYAGGLTHHYDDKTDFIIYDDVCDISNLSQGMKAEVIYFQGQKAFGCWHNGKDKTVIIQIEIGNGQFYEYSFYKTKFEVQ